MVKVIEFILFFALVYWAIYIYPKRAARKRQKSTQAPPQPKPQVLQMVTCSFCKIRLPLGDSYEFQKRYFCNPDHFSAVNVEGWLGSAKHLPSPNYDERPQGISVDTVVIHHISLPEGRFGGNAIESFFTNQLNPKEDPYFETIAHLEVSPHFLIKRDGELIQFVSTLNRAWHAGASNLLGRERVNDFSIGIELEGTGDLPYELVQYQALAKLITAIEKKNTVQYFVGHSDISPDRKTDPGQSFDWQYVSKMSKIPENKLPFGVISR